MESMALHRLEWIASALDAFAPEQSGFRRLRSTADSLAYVVTTLEDAASRHEARYLVLLDVERAFDGLTHGTIIVALRELRITGRLLDYVSAFLNDRTLRVRVGDAVSTHSSVTSGVPQGTVLSPYLFILALARLPDFIPKGSGMGQPAPEFSTLIASLPQLLPLPPSPHASALLDVNITVPGVKSKRQTAPCAMQQETVALIFEHIRDRLLVYTDGSVSSNGSIAAACTAADISLSRQCHLRFPASSTAAELAAIDLAADLLLQQCGVSSAAILSDSRAALCMLRKDYAGLPLVQRVGSKLCHLVNQGCDFGLQWVPAHNGLPGYEAADSLAKQALSTRFPLASYVTGFDVAKTAILRILRAQYPDPRVPAGFLK
ncbi:uncharacterized protein [Dermacentor andersoni]|uniref:uncharacterized protein n=1 Tax=Dermacentor andersoni TaxID=34620 RepID=UPI003B3B3785